MRTSISLARLAFGAALVPTTLASAATAQCGEVAELFPVPAPCCEAFGDAIAATETHVFVSGDSRTVHMFRTSDLLQLATFQSPGVDSSFGEALDANGSRMLAGAPDIGEVGIPYGGRAYLYDTQTFSLVDELTPTGPMDQLFYYGQSVALHGDFAAVSGEEDVNDDRTGVVRLFDLSGSPTQVLRIEGAQEEDEFGRWLALSDDYLCIAGFGRIAVHDLATLSWIGDISLAPYPGNLAHLALVEDRLYAGMNGKVWVFDAATQTQLGQLIPEYQPGQNGGYGKRVAASDESLADARVAVTRPLRQSQFVFDADSFVQQDRYVSSHAAQDLFLSPYEPVIAINSTRMFVGSSGRVFVYDLDAPCEFSTFCYGDGSTFTPCLCGNESAVGDREGCRNSTGVGARLRADGSASIVADDLQLHVEQGPIDQPGVFVQGSTATRVTFFDGVLCMGNPTLRLQFATFDGAGMLSSTTGLAASGGVNTPATTRHYQLWYRDPGVSPCGAGANLSNAVRVDWR